MAEETKLMSFLNREVTSGERRWALGFALVVMLITSLPYLLGFAVQGKDWVFSGFVFGMEDGNSYISKMMRGYAGDWLFRSAYTTAEQSGSPASLSYILLGKLTAPPEQHLQLVVLFHLFRFGAGMLAILASYDFIALFVRDVKLRRWGVGVTALGGGLGWALVLLGRSDWLGSLPLDFISPESFGFLALYGLPHLALGRAALLWAFVAYLAAPPEAIRQPRELWGIERTGLLAGLLLLVVGFMQPLTTAQAWAVMAGHLTGLGLYLLWKRRTEGWGLWLGYLKRAAWAVVVSSPLVVFSVARFSSDSYLQAWTAQNTITSPHPLHYLLAYGFGLPFVVVGARRMLHEDARRAWLPVAWVIALPLFVYAPIEVQRRLAEGVWVALAALTVKAFEGGRISKTWILLPIFPTTLFLLVGGMLAVRQPAEPLFYPAAQVEAMEYLGAVAEDGAVVLAAYDTGNRLPAFAAVRVAIGHGPETVGLAELRPRVEAFYGDEMSDEERRDFLEEFGVQYVFWGPEEQELGDWLPEGAEYLEVIYREREHWIFEVK